MNTRPRGSDPSLGFGGFALPVVLHHNTPNNSVGQLWADTSERNDGANRRALFPRRERHNPERPWTRIGIRFDHALPSNNVMSGAF